MLSVTYKAVKLRASDPEWRTFYVTNDRLIDLYLDYKQMTQKYHKGVGRVWWQNRNGRIHGQPHGEHFFTDTLYKEIARRLGKENWMDYSGHSMPRSCATAFANSGM